MDQFHYSEMSPQLGQEWTKLSDEAIGRMRNHRPSHKRCLFRIDINTAFDDACMFYILTDEKSRSVPQYYVESLFWKRKTDLKKFCNPIVRLRHPKNIEPTIEFHTYELDSQIAEKFIHDISMLKIPPIVEKKTIGLDGVTYTLSALIKYERVSFEWWGNGPEEWRPLTSLVDKFLYDLGFSLPEGYR